MLTELAEAIARIQELHEQSQEMWGAYDRSLGGR
jgi:hypothetical protein